MRSALGFGFFSILLGLTFMGCGPGEVKQKESLTLKAYRLIDEQRTDEAIDILEQEFKKDSSNYEVRVVLASAFAHKAGFKIQRFGPTLEEALKISNAQSAEKKKPTTKHKKAKATEENRVDQSLAELADFLIQSSSYLKLYSSLPMIASKDLSYLNHSLSLLEELNDDIEPEDALYRSIIRILLIKHYLAEEFVGDVIFADHLKAGQCRLRLEVGIDVVTKIGKLMIQTFGDLALVYPDQSEEFEIQAKETANQVSNLALTFTSLQMIKEIDETFVLPLVSSFGLGRIFECGSLK